MAAARDELKILAGGVQAAEQASPNPISQQGVEAIKRGRSIWSPAESKTNRELARAWLSWALPDRCDTTARSLSANSALLGRALKYNTPEPEPAPPASEPPAAAAESPPAPTSREGTPTSAPPAAEPTPPAPTPDPGPAASPAPQADPPAALPQIDPNGPVPDPPSATPPQP
jgi:hypothetical protein